MKTVKTNLLIIYTAGILFLFCWNKQEHEILVPKIPVYNLSGRIICSLTNEPLADVNVDLTGTVKYNEEDSQKTLNLQQVTDENGMFTFTEVPGGFGYLLDAEKKGYQALTKKLVMYYENKNLEQMILGKLLVWQDEYYIIYHKISGIVYKEGRIWIADTLDRKITELNNDQTIKRSINFAPYKPKGLAYDGQFFWTSDSKNEIILKFHINSNGSINFDTSYAAPKNFYHPEQAVALVDISWADGEIWACSKQITVKYFKFNPMEPKSVSYFDSPMYNPKGIAVDDGKIYIVCQYSDEPTTLYILDKDTKTILGYSIIPGDPGLITVNGNFIWTGKDNRIIKYSF